MDDSTVAAVVFACGESDEKDAAAKTNPAQQQAIINLAEQVKQNPDSAGLRMQLIQSLDSAERYKDAIAQADSLIKKDSLNNGLWFTKAQLQEDNRDTAAAIKSYIRAIRIYPSVEAQLSLANLLAENRNPNALLVCRDVQKLGMGRETEADCDFISGVYYARTGNGKQALQQFDQAINENYTLMEAYMEKGFIYYDSKNYPEALKIFDKAITVNNLYADAYYWRAKCNEAEGNKQEALINYKRSLGLDKKLKEAADAIKRLE